MQPDTNGVMRVWADFEGHTTQSNLKVIVERGSNHNNAQDASLIEKIETTIRNSLSFKAQVILVDANSFEKPGVAKVALTLRDAPNFI
jgi:phenylacetate-CoA ligase